MNRLMSSPQWPPSSGCQETTEDSKEGEGEGEGDNRDNSDKNTVAVHSHCSKCAPSPLSTLIVLL